MAIANGISTFGGSILVTPGGSISLAVDPAAPNATDFGETLTIGQSIDPEAPGTVSLNIPSLPAGVVEIALVFHYTDQGGGRSVRTFRTLAQEGLVNLGTVYEVLGDLAGFPGLTYEIAAIDSSGRVGFSDGEKATADPVVEDTPPQIASAVLIGTGQTTTEHTVAVDVSGTPAPDVTYSWRVNGTEVATTAAYTPGSGTTGTLRCDVTAENTAGAATVSTGNVTLFTIAAPVLNTPTINGTGQTGTLHSVSYTYATTGVPAPEVTIQWKLDGVNIGGATSSSYTPVASSGTLTVSVTATNASGADTKTSAGKTITSSPTNVVPVVSSATLSGTGVSGTSHTVSHVATGTPTPTIARQWKLGGVNISGATSSTYTPPISMAGLLTAAVTASNSEGSHTLESASITLTPVAPSAAQWSISGVSNPTSSTSKLDEITIASSLGATEAQWTTATTEMSTAEIEAIDGFEDMSLGSTAGGNQKWNVADAIVGTRNFRIFDPATYSADTARAGRIRIRIKDASGQWGPLTLVKSVPLPSTNTKIHAGDWIPLIHRSKQQFEGVADVNGVVQGANTVGGGGYQYFRSWGYSPAKPDRLFGVQDIACPILTNDFGGWWEHPRLANMKVGVSGQGAHIAQKDGDRILILHSAGSLRGQDGSPNGWDKHAGIYLSTDGGNTATLRKQIDYLGGSASDDDGETNVRYMQQPFVEIPSATLPNDATKSTFWCIAHRMPKLSMTKNSLVLKSVDGGATWTEESTLAPSFGMPLIFRHVGGVFWLGTSNGLYRATNPAGTWTNISTSTNLPDSGMVSQVDVGGATNEVWISIRGNGLWKTTTGGTGASSWSQVYAYDIETFAISPHNRNIILVAGDNGVTPKRSTNGGSSFGNITTRPFPGQPENFQSEIHDTHAYFIWHATNANKVFAARFQHFGVSNDAGASFDWSSNNFDYNYNHQIASDPDPANWQRMLISMQDRVCVYTPNGHDWVYDDGVGKAEKSALATKGSITGHMGAGRGALILANGSQRAFLAALGNTQNRAIFRMTANGSNPIGTFANTIPYYGGQWCNYGVRLPSDSSIGFIGRQRITLSGAGAVSSLDVGKEVVAVGSGDVVYGIDKSGSSKVIYKSDNAATAGSAGAVTWSTWATLPQTPRPFDPDPRGISYDPTHAGKVLVACSNGVFALVTQGSPVTVRTVATVTALRPGAVSAVWPDAETYATALDPLSTAAYVTLNNYGGPVIYKTANINAATPVWTDITGYDGNMAPCPHKVYVDEHTGDVICSYHHGSVIYPAHAEVSGRSRYNRVLTYLQNAQI